MLKRFSTQVVLFSMFVVLPLGSYLYLKRGFEYRKTIKASLSYEEDFQMHSELDTTVTKIFGNTTVFLGSEEEVVLIKLFDQFKDAPSFQLVTDLAKPEAFSTYNNFIVLDSLAFSGLRETNSAKVGFIIDKNTKVRRLINQEISQDSAKILVEQIAYLLPNK